MLASPRSTAERAAASSATARTVPPSPSSAVPSWAATSVPARPAWFTSATRTVGVSPSRMMKVMSPDMTSGATISSASEGRSRTISRVTRRKSATMRWRLTG